MRWQTEYQQWQPNQQKPLPPCIQDENNWIRITSYDSKWYYINLMNFIVLVLTIYLKAGERMDAKLSSCPIHITSSAGWIELYESPTLGDGLSLLRERTVQNLHNPKCPGLLELDVSPIHSSWRKTTIFRIAEQTVKTAQRIPTDFECCKV